MTELNEARAKLRARPLRSVKVRLATCKPSVKAILIVIVIVIVVVIVIFIDIVIVLGIVTVTIP